MRVAQTRSPWRELWKPSASSGMNGWNDDDEEEEEEEEEEELMITKFGS